MRMIAVVVLLALASQAGILQRDADSHSALG
jgi:hypothetical protein